MLVKPTLNLIPNFDGNKEFLIIFVSNFGDQVFGNEVEIQNLKNNLTVYNKKIDSFQLTHLLSSNSLKNDESYKIHIRTFNIRNEMSEWSDWMIFSCYSTPIIGFTNINDQMNNQTIIVKGSYSQNGNDTLQYYKFIIYNENNLIVSESPLMFDGLLQYEFTGFENNKNYTVELQVTTQSNIFTSIQKTFFVKYIQPKIKNILALENDEENACINIDIRMTRIIGQVKKGEIKYEDAEWLDVTNGIVYFDKEHGFEINGDYTLQIWCKNLVEDKEFLILLGDNNVELRLVLYDNRIHCFKLINNTIYSHYASNIVNIDSLETQVYIFMQCVNQRVEIKSEII